VQQRHCECSNESGLKSIKVQNLPQFSGSGLFERRPRIEVGGRMTQSEAITNFF